MHKHLEAGNAMIVVEPRAGATMKDSDADTNAAVQIRVMGMLM